MQIVSRYNKILNIIKYAGCVIFVLVQPSRYLFSAWLTLIITLVARVPQYLQRINRIIKLVLIFRCSKKIFPFIGVSTWFCIKCLSSSYYIRMITDCKLTRYLWCNYTLYSRLNDKTQDLIHEHLFLNVPFCKQKDVLNVNAILYMFK